MCLFVCLFVCACTIHGTHVGAHRIPCALVVVEEWSTIDAHVEPLLLVEEKNQTVANMVG